MLGINGWELIALAVLGILILGPDRMPEYAQKLAQLIFRVRHLAEGAKDQLKDQLGDDYKDINWRQYDPRQYDPRRIVRDALAEPIDRPEPVDGAEPVDDPAPVGSRIRLHDPFLPTPYDVDAT